MCGFVIRLQSCDQTSTLCAVLLGQLCVAHHTEGTAVTLQNDERLFIGALDNNAVVSNDPCLWEMKRFEGGLVQLQMATIEADLFLQSSGKISVEPHFFRICFVRAPIVDISPLLNKESFGEACVQGCAQKIIDAAQDVGYFYVTGVPMATSRGAELIAHCLAAYSKSPLSSQFSKHTLASTTGFVKTHFSPPTFAPIVLPSWLSDDCSELVRAYFAEAVRVACCVLKVLTQDSPEIGEESFSLLRLVGYSSGESGYLDDHTDKSWVTLLVASTLKGLQFLGNDGDSYDQVPDVENSVLVNVGDALQMHSGGSFFSRPHKVVYLDGGNRVSIPLFVEPTQYTWPVPRVAESVVTVEL